MFQFTETIAIDAPPAKVWKTLIDIEKWWPPSNPEHVDIEVRASEKPIGVGTKIAFHERVAGVEAQAEGLIRSWMPETEAGWTGSAVYRYYGIPIRIREGVSWLIEGGNKSSSLSATVWAEFPPTTFGRFFEWYAITLLNIVHRDRDHTRCELEYLKRMVEEAG